MADSFNYTIRKITPDGEVTTLAGSAGEVGSDDGTGSAARFGGVGDGPRGLAVDGAGNIYVADSGNYTVRKITPDGDVTTLAGSPDQRGSLDASGNMARFAYPRGVRLDSAGNVYVADWQNHTIRRITPGGNVTTLAGRA